MPTLDAQEDKVLSTLHIETALSKSHLLSKRHGFDVLLKLENTQVPGSFKIRGIGNMCAGKLKENPNASCFVIASGGNAGLATSYAGMLLGLPVHVFVPSTTPESVIALFKQYEGSTVTVYGKVFNEANQKAVEFCEAVNGIFIHPFDDPLIWNGHATMISEIDRSLRPSGTVPSCIVVSVGGGGLLMGVMEGVLGHKAWNSVPILAMETEGADCLNKSIQAGTSVRLPTISSIAKSLGSLEVCPEVLKRMHQVTLLSEVVSDEVALSACRKFAEDHRYIVEPACGAALAAVYGGVLAKLAESGKVDLKSGPAVIIVCGGVSTEMVWKT